MKELLTRISNLEKRNVEEFLTVLEIMSNVIFFGGIKKANCEYAKNGQCGLFHLQSDAESKIPVATKCRIPDCNSSYYHCHLEISNVTCSFCPQWNNNPGIKPDKYNSLRRKNKRKKEIA